MLQSFEHFLWDMREEFELFDVENALFVYDFLCFIVVLPFFWWKDFGGGISLRMRSGH